MSMERILEAVRAFDGVLVFVARPGDGTPELAWGDAFMYHAPDGVMPTTEQPYGTIVTKDYPGDESSRLGGGRYRVNIHVRRDRAEQLVSEGDTDVFLPHPLYARQGWVSIVNPQSRVDEAIELLAEAHEASRRRHERRA
ncbi:MAG TPA: DUF6194 family protein [Rhodoglobus sp.]|nr:DUF6194 family protein [Rhodoglobus sp.]